VRAVSVLLAVAVAALLNRVLSALRPRPTADLLVRCRDEAASIEGKLRRLHQSGRYRTIYVQDVGSRDETAAIVRRLARELDLVPLAPDADPPSGVAVLGRDTCL